jgi:hypothetical protein
MRLRDLVNCYWREGPHAESDRSLTVTTVAPVVLTREGELGEQFCRDAGHADLYSDVLTLTAWP